MKLNCNNYLASYRDVIYLLRNQNGTPEIERIGSTSVATNVPIVAVCQFYEREFGSSAQLTQFRTRLCAFYQVDLDTGVDNEPVL